MQERFFKVTRSEFSISLPLLSSEDLDHLQTLCDEGIDINTLLIQKMPKTDLHVHAEAGILIDTKLAKIIAARNNIPFPDDLVDDQTQQWKFTGSDNLDQFIKDFRRISNILQTPQDIEDIIYAFYKHCYEHRVIFALPGISWIQCKEQMTFLEFNQAYNRGLARGIKDFGDTTTLRLRYYQERHINSEEFQKIWDMIQQYPNPMITTIGLAGSEDGFPLDNFFEFFESLNHFRQKMGNPWYFLTAHVEPESPERTIEVARNYLDWFAHGRNIADYPQLKKTLKTSGMTLEICPLSDVAFFPKSIPDLQAHTQFQALFKEEMISLNSDDPAFCGTIDEVYQCVFKALNCDLALLFRCTYNGLFPAARSTLESMRFYAPETYQTHILILENGMLKLKFFETYCRLLQEIRTISNTHRELKKQILEISLHTPLSELNRLSSTLLKIGKETRITSLIDIRQEIIRTAKVLETKTLQAIEQFERDCRLSQEQAFSGLET
ncbi:hypothetical protein [Legionella sp. PC997]|uniref:hypothetical protein n=1 Tax=Legionella sp. PC997 TaxID=2755562 RepID=UPI0015FA4CA6|nr:hypothetical protein [Legionella sp. PC997]QMT59168.1 Adenine deaminase [Legionella sp. PC997]